MKKSLKDKLYLCAAGLTLVLTCAAVSSCSQSKNKDAGSPILLETDIVMKLDTAYLGSFRPFLMGRYIITDLLAGDNKLALYEIRGDSVVLINETLRYGNGPDEVMDIDVFPGKDTSVTVFNCAGGSPVSLISIPIPSGANNPESLEKYPLDKIKGLRGTTFSGVTISDSTLLVNSATFGKESIFSILDFKNGILKELEWMPDDGSDLPEIVRQGVYMDNSNLYGGKNRYLYVCGEGAYAFIFRPQGEGIQILETISDKYPDYSAMQDGLNYTLTRESPQLFATVTDDHIYLLRLDSNVNGETPKNNYPREYGADLTVYDWDGKETAKYKLDRIGKRIMVADDDSTLYLIGNDPATSEETIVRYRLK
ncbi:MAG: TolB-like 6-bladed beta-propeller domain-containing protein [Muribaculaceae bacterium]|nr:TolB-like 6-bladed beta-propeller domain-containing protein [Muribaculaceae bacterium]